MGLQPASAEQFEAVEGGRRGRVQMASDPWGVWQAVGTAAIGDVMQHPPLCEAGNMPGQAIGQNTRQQGSVDPLSGSPSPRDSAADNIVE